MFLYCILSVLFFHRVNFFTSTLFLYFIHIIYLTLSLYVYRIHILLVTVTVTDRVKEEWEQHTRKCSRADAIVWVMVVCAHVWQNDRIDCVTMNDSIRDNVVVRTDCLRKIDGKNSMIKAIEEWLGMLLREWKCFQRGQRRGRSNCLFSAGYAKRYWTMIRCDLFLYSTHIVKMLEISF